jgi:hypothetical protein
MDLTYVFVMVSEVEEFFMCLLALYVLFIYIYMSSLMKCLSMCFASLARVMFFWRCHEYNYKLGKLMLHDIEFIKGKSHESGATSSVVVPCCSSCVLSLLNQEIMFVIASNLII